MLHTVVIDWESFRCKSVEDGWLHGADTNGNGTIYILGSGEYPVNYKDFGGSWNILLKWTNIGSDSPQTDYPVIFPGYDNDWCLDRYFRESKSVEFWISPFEFAWFYENSL